MGNVAEFARDQFNATVDGLVMGKLLEQGQLPQLPSGITLSGQDFGGTQNVLDNSKGQGIEGNER
jgi:hypothetical protein